MTSYEQQAVIVIIQSIVDPEAMFSLVSLFGAGRTSCSHTATDGVCGHPRLAYDEEDIASHS